MTGLGGSRPRVSRVVVTPVAFADPPLLNVVGVHQPWALRAIVEVHTDSGLVGLGETYADEAHLEVFVAWQCAQQLRRVYHQPDPATGRRLAEHIVATFSSCPIPEVARLGRTLKKWRREFLAYFDTAGASNGGTEAVNGLIELHRRVARGFRNRDNYRLRMLLAAGGLTP